MSSPVSLQHLVERAEALLARIEAVVPHPPAAPDWSASIAFRYRKRAGSGVIEPVRHVAPIRLGSLVEVEAQK
ncbi:MAG: AAA family ATPase, partial [Caldimonas sp.]